MFKLFFAGCIGDTHPSVRYLMREKRRGLERVCKPILGSKAKPLAPRQSVKFGCMIWSEITKKVAEKCLDASSL